MEKRLPLPVGTVLQGRYRIIRQMGHGGFGAVYEAVDDEIALSFALKETFYAADEELRQAFKREARMLASLSHEAFPRVSHYFTEGDGCFLVMELIQGDDLDKLLSRRTEPFEQEQILTWADQILDALEDLHAGGIVHRDIKPSNLKLTPKGKIKLLDFGIAKGALEGETTILTTVGSMAAATLQYAPLEQVLKASPQHQMMLSVSNSDKVTEIMQYGTSAASDLYALAATLYQLLTKKLPADAATRALAIWSGQQDRLIPVNEVNPKVSKEVSEALQKAMSLDRAGRYQTAAEMRRVLKETVKSVTVETKPAPTELFSNAGYVTELLPNETYVTEQVTRLKAPPPTQQAQQQQTMPALQSSFTPVLPQQSSKKTNKTVIYAGAIGLPVLLLFGLITGAFVYFNISRNSTNTNSTSTTPTPKIPVAAKYELAQTLTGHQGSVHSIAFSPDGETIASASYGLVDENNKFLGIIRLWDAKTGDFKQIFAGNGDHMWALAFSPDGKTIADGSSSESINLWDAASGALRQTLMGHKSVVRDLAFSPDGKMLASASDDDTAKLWDLTSGKLKQTLTGHTKDLATVSISPDGQTVVTGSWDNSIKLWDANNGSLKKTLTGHNAAVMEVAFSPDGSTIVSAGCDNMIKLWDAASGTIKLTLTGHNGSVYAVAFSPDGKMIASGSDDKTVKLWDAKNGTLKQTLEGHTWSVESLAFSPDGKTIASGGGDKTVMLWRLK